MIVESGFGNEKHDGKILALLLHCMYKLGTGPCVHEGHDAACSTESGEHVYYCHRDRPLKREGPV